jgi:hypothetical protein
MIIVGALGIGRFLLDLREIGAVSALPSHKTAARKRAF